MRIAQIEAARELGLDARDLVGLVSSRRSRTGVRDVVVGLLSSLLAAVGVRRRDDATVGQLDFRRAADRLDEYAEALAALVAAGDDPVLAAHLELARTWGARIWDDPRREGTAVLAELRPTIDRLVELRTMLILGRNAGDGAGQPPDG